MIYDYWLVTKGAYPFLRKDRSFTPLVLLPQFGNTLLDLRDVVEKEARRRALIFVPDDSPPMDVLKALCSDYALNMIRNLYLHQVRLLPSEVVSKDELSMTWKFSGEELPSWQGAADGVIPKNFPVTVFSLHAGSSPFRIIF